MNEGVDVMTKFEMNEDVMQAVAELSSDTGDCVADVISNPNILDHLIEDAGYYPKNFSKKVKKMFAQQLFEEYMREEKRYALMQIDMMYDEDIVLD